MKKKARRAALVLILLSLTARFGGETGEMEPNSSSHGGGVVWSDE
jgi:hypothetical protein